MIVSVASDHRGVCLRESILTFLTNSKYHYKDFGVRDHTVSVDYPDQAEKVCEEVRFGDSKFGILICKTGVGMCIAANRFKRIRAAVVSNPMHALIARKHNNANVMCFGSDMVDRKLAIELVNIFLTTEFDRGRHIFRIEKVEYFE